jgi:hypothetical protein
MPHYYNALYHFGIQRSVCEVMHLFCNVWVAFGSTKIIVQVASGPKVSHDMEVHLHTF